MGTLNRALSWYQHKIGAYDKQIWEQTVEQRILHGLTHVPKKSGKLKLDYIDLDLVRGSSFPKAKPKHGLIYLSQLCLIRLLFLPFYRHWWIRQTSVGIFQFLLVLYGFQIVNMAIYFSRPIVQAGVSDLSSSVVNVTADAEIISHDVTAEEVFLPILMMIILSFLLSQMVSTHGNPCRSVRRNKSKVRMKRTKRKLARRTLGTATLSDSKSSLDNLENPQPPPDRKDLQEEPSTIKKRSLSEERPSSRIQVGQRSASVQLDSVQNHQPPSTCKVLPKPSQPEVENSVTLKKTWFFPSWPVLSGRLVVPKRTHNEDEGFDSFHGNNSSSSEFENDDKIEIAAACSEGQGGEGSQCTNVDETAQSDGCQDYSSKLETCGLDLFQNGHQDSKVEELKQPLLRRRRDVPSIALKLIPPDTNHSYNLQSESESEIPRRNPKSVTILSNQRRKDSSMVAGESSYQSSCESDGDGQSSVASPSYKLSEPSTPVDWTGVTTNSEECSYSSESRSESDDNETNRFASVVGDINWNDELTFAWESHGPSTLSSNISDKVSCTVWEGMDVKKADLSVLDVAAAIIAKVDVIPESTDYLFGGLVMAAIFALLPIFYRINGAVGTAFFDLLHAHTLRKALQSTSVVCDILLGTSRWEKIIVVTAAAERFAMAAFFLFLLAVAERTFKQRFLYAKLFSHLTSSRRARNSDLPHFRLNKVRNIKTWLSVRSYLKKRGPQRSVDCIVSAAFVITLCLVSFLCMELLKESQYLHQSLYNLEVLCWCLVLGVFLLRFMTLGSKINKKYRNLSVLITEQINLYLQMEQKPNKKEELMLANNVLKLAADLLKELESPFKISGLSANPYLYNLTKVVVLSALSGVLSEMLGFKLKLHKIKIR